MEAFLGGGFLQEWLGKKEHLLINQHYDSCPLLSPRTMVSIRYSPLSSTGF